MSQPHESHTQKPQPPTDDDATRTVPSPTTTTTNAPRPLPPVPPTDEQFQRLDILSNSLAKDIDDFEDTLGAMVLSLQQILSPEQQLSEPANSVLQSRERYKRILADLKEWMALVRACLEYEHRKAVYQESYAEKLEGYVKRLVGMVDWWMARGNETLDEVRIEMEKLRDTADRLVETIVSIYPSTGAESAD